MNFLTYLKNIPRKVFLWIGLAIAIILIILEFLAKSTALKAKDMNLSALISDAIDKFQISTNKSKIKDLDKKPKKEDLEKDPSKVEEFYKNRK